MSRSSKENEERIPEVVATSTGPVVPSVTEASSNAAAERRAAAAAAEEEEEEEEGAASLLMPPTPVRERARGFLHLACT